MRGRAAHPQRVARAGECLSVLRVLVSRNLVLQQRSARLLFVHLHLLEQLRRAMGVWGSVNQRELETMYGMVPRAPSSGR
jgi:hypothetical protein